MTRQMASEVEVPRARSDFDRSNVGPAVGEPCTGAPCAGVGVREAACHPMQTQPLDDERELHIEDAHWLYRTAYERFELYGNPHDRDEALQHLHRMNEAILMRSPAVLAARHAAFEQRISEGVDYFNSEHASALARKVAA